MRDAAEQLVRRFLRAFEDLDLAGMADCFADDATMFFPVPEPPELVVGRTAILDRFEAVAADIRSEASSGPPYHRLDPVGLTVLTTGPEAAVVTFELRRPDRTGRRTFVVRRTDGDCRVVHLHASNTPQRADTSTG